MQACRVSCQGKRQQKRRTLIASQQRARTHAGCANFLLSYEGKHLLPEMPTVPFATHLGFLKVALVQKLCVLVYLSSPPPLQPVALSCVILAGFSALPPQIPDQLQKNKTLKCIYLFLIFLVGTKIILKKKTYKINKEITRSWTFHRVVLPQHCCKIAAHWIGAF